MSSDVAVYPVVVDVVVTPAIAEVSSQGLQGIPGPPGGSYERTFTQADLSVAGILPIIHNLDSYPSGVLLWNASGEQVWPDRLEILTLNTLSVTLQNFAPIAGTWTISIVQ